MIIHTMDQNSAIWDKFREGIPTGSRASDLVTGNCVPSTSINRYAKFLANTKMAGHDPDGFGGNKFTKRGHEQEPHADDDYQFIRGVETQEVGFISDDLVTYGASPDRLAGKNGMVEYKCLTGEEFISVGMYYSDYGTCEPGYIPQTQFELMVAEREWNDLVFYHPKYTTLIIRQYPDLKFQDLLKEKIEEVIILRNLIIKTIQSL